MLIGDSKQMIPIVSTRLAITAGSALVLATILVLNTLWIWQREQTRLIDNQNALLHGTMQLAEMGLKLAGDRFDTDFRRGLIQDISDHMHIGSAHIIDEAGLILQSTRTADIGQNWSEAKPAPKNLEIVTDSSRFQTFLDSESNLVGLLRLCPLSTTSSPAACETLYLETTTGDFLAAVKAELLTQLLTFSSVIAFCVFAILAILDRRLFQPARRTIANLDRFAAGDHNLRCSPHGAWELRSLVDSVNKLFDTIQQGEKKLLEKQTMYAALLETMGDGLITMQPNGNIESMNSAAEKLLGFKRRELVGKRFNQLLADKSISQSSEFTLQEYISTHTAGNGDSHWEVWVQNKSGDEVPARISIRNMIIDDKNIFICVLSNIADIKEMEEELLQLNKQLSHTNERLEHSVITDSLTGLYNRRHFDATFSKEIARATRQSTALSLLVVDIDYFKQYNDRYGHLLGDDCLSRVGKCLNQLFKRSGDLPSRYGGEEFVIVLPGCDGLDLQERAETLRTAIEELRMPHAGSSVSDVVTVSIGSVTYRPLSDEVVAPKARELFKEADKALYRAKENGRNRVEFAGVYEANSALFNSQVADSILSRHMPANSNPE